MATIVDRAGGGKLLRDPRVVCAGWALFLVVVLCAVFHREGVFDPHSTEVERLWPFRWLMLLHTIPGLAVLLIGPAQFSGGLRRERPRLHRACGYVYVVSMAITALLGARVALVSSPATIHFEAYFRSAACVATTSLAIACAVRKDFAAHRLWMLRSYCLGLTFIVSRLPQVTFNVFFSAEMQHNWLWFLDVVALLGPDLVLTGMRLVQPRPAGKPDRATAAARLQARTSIAALDRA